MSDGPLSIKAIPTEYAGVRYRSRTEARWAVFFSLLDIPFSYEPCKVDTGISNYVPDFVLPTLNTVFEVKGCDPTDVEKERIADLNIAGHTYLSTWRIVTSGAPDRPLVAVNRYQQELSVDRIILSQCAYCGVYGLFVEYADATDLCPRDHLKCPVAYEASREIDIAYDFYSGYSKWAETPLHPRVSPAVQLAIKASCSISFESRNFYEVLEIHKDAQRVLRQSNIYASSLFLNELYPYLVKLRKGEQCPRFFGTTNIPLNENDKAEVAT